jgi:hypothetical protein
MDEHARLSMSDSVESLCKAACIVWMCYFLYLSTLDEGSSFMDKPKSCKRSNSGNCCFFGGVQWVVQGVLDVDALIGANASAEGGGEDEGVNDEAKKVVDIIDTFRLQEQPPFDKKGFMAYMKKYLKALIPLVPEERQAQFKDIQEAAKYLVSKLGDFQL